MFLLLRARELGVPQEQIPLLWAGISLITAVFGTPLSALSDRFSRRHFIAAAWAIYALIYVGMAYSGLTLGWLYGLFVLYGLFKAATEGVEKALVADLAPPGFTGRAFGWFNMCSGIMLLPASLIFGVLYETYSPTVAFLFSGGCAVLALMLLLLWVFKTEKLA